MYNLFSTAAYAAGEQAQQPGIMDMMLLPMAFLIIMYFFIIRPQQRKTKEHAALLAALKAGDEVVTSGGIIGKVKSIAEGFVTLDIGGQSSLKIIKGHIAALSKNPDEKLATSNK